MKNIPIDDDLDKLISSTATQLNIPKKEVLKFIINTFVNEDGINKSKTIPKSKLQDIKFIEKELKGDKKMDEGNPLGDLIRFYMVKNMTKEDDTLPLDKILAFGVIKQLLQPQQNSNIDPAILVLLMNSGGKDSKELLQTLLTLQQQQQQQYTQQNQNILQMLMGERMKKLEESIQETKRTAEQNFVSVLNRLENALTQALNKRETLTEELQKYKALRDAILDFAETEGIKKEQVVTPSGKINWAGVLDNLFRTVSKVTSDIARIKSSGGMTRENLQRMILEQAQMYEQQPIEQKPQKLEPPKEVLEPEIKIKPETETKPQPQIEIKPEPQVEIKKELEIKEEPKQSKMDLLQPVGNEPEPKEEIKEEPEINVKVEETKQEPVKIENNKSNEEEIIVVEENVKEENNRENKK